MQRCSNSIDPNPRVIFFCLDKFILRYLNESFAKKKKNNENRPALYNSAGNSSGCSEESVVSLKQLVARTRLRQSNDSKCGVLFWRIKGLKRHFKDKQIHYHCCCENGHVVLQHFAKPPPLFKQLLQTQTFLDNIRAYNQMFSTTSFGPRVDDSINDGRSPYVFKVSGQIYHWIDRLYSEVVSQLVQLLDRHNKLVKLFRTAQDKCTGVKIPMFKVCLLSVVGSKQHAPPSSNAVGAIVFDTGPETVTDYDVIIEPLSDRPRRINKLHLLYMSFQYPLMFFFGEPGFHHGLMLRDITASQRGRAWKIIELDRMDYIRMKQQDIRNEYLTGLHDTINRGDRTDADMGSRTILPASFTGGPLLHWPKIVRYLQPYPYLTASDRADIVSRVFYSKVKEFVTFLKQEKHLGSFRGILYTIEFQKRGLPHCHTLLWVHSEVSGAIIEHLDDYISAELPDPRSDPIGYAVISVTMMHGPCGLSKTKAPCMEGNTGVYTTHSGVELDNIYVVPYNRLLILSFQAHINVECCGSTMLIKYLFKYISKGTDRVATCISKPLGTNNSQTPEKSEPVDEIQNFIDARFICPHEACWRIFKFPIHHRCISFEDIRTVNEVVHHTYRSACEAVGLLGDDKEWATALEEASASSSELRLLFAQISGYCDVTNQLELWEKHWKLMADDIPLRVAASLNMPKFHINDEDLHNYVLYEVEILLNQSAKLISEYGLPDLPPNLLLDLANRLIMEEKNYDRESLNNQWVELERRLNGKQKQVYELVISASYNQQSELVLFTATVEQERRSYGKRLSQHYG
ncbi:uncharacterized protein [Rutidosis leptorrhynchoides]|uniref:uncharacterized protein n=1 Tax=Rutidosis leptorrhynchoides TaxID=125765 RepID=UPI003A9975CF